MVKIIREEENNGDDQLALEKTVCENRGYIIDIGCQIARMKMDNQDQYKDLSGKIAELNAYISGLYALLVCLLIACTWLAMR